MIEEVEWLGDQRYCCRRVRTRAKADKGEDGVGG